MGVHPSKNKYVQSKNGNSEIYFVQQVTGSRILHNHISLNISLALQFNVVMLFIKDNTMSLNAYFKAL